MVYIVILDSGLVTEIGIHVTLMGMVMKKVTITKIIMKDVHYSSFKLLVYSLCPSLYAKLKHCIMESQNYHMFYSFSM